MSAVIEQTGLSQASLDDETLLPDNRTAFERSYEEGVKSLVKSEQVLPDLNHPETIASELLPYMASERGVNDWFFSDSESEKRAITAVSYVAHQHSGTAQGIMDASDAVNFEIDIQHWKQVPDGQPYTLYVQAKDKSSQTISEQRAKRLMARIEFIKSVRDTLDMTFTFGCQAPVYLGGAHVPASNVGTMSASATLWPMPKASCQLGMATHRMPAINTHPIYAQSVFDTDVLSTQLSAYGCLTHGISCASIIARAINE
ncbi:phage tail protein I [Vibrio azureus]|uniref:Putative phage tail protein n=1 Tax=Vibrio azureus NBRC 104587 TaxID=1219077 RepID=U3AMK5_9VIBR|nr:phage tail protein I [Vibrio azureus]AUI87562.1 phage tail protein I [Vibrio azureus]GAD74532.1 putative phage tail protein [Vibrio azureus NBRC 104587]